MANDTQNLKTLRCLAYVLAIHVLCESLDGKGIDVCTLTHLRLQNYE